MRILIDGGHGAETAVRTEYVPDTAFIEIPMESERVTVRDTASRLETSYAVSDTRLNTDGALCHSLENKAWEHPVKVKKEVVCWDSVVCIRTGRLRKRKPSKWNAN